MNANLLAAVLGALAATLIPSETMTLRADGDVQNCGCEGTYTNPRPKQLTAQACNNPPLIVPTSPEAENGECAVEGESCSEVAGAKCIGSVDVQVTFPSTGNTCNSIWVMGGKTYETPTQINATSQMVKLKVSAACKKLSSNEDKATFKIWLQAPATPAHEPDASYEFSLKCGNCQKIRPQQPL